MTIAVVQKVYAAGALVTSITTAAISTTSGNLVVADCIVFYPLGNVAIVVDSAGNIWNGAIVPHINGGTTPDRAEQSQYYAANITGSGSYTVTVGLSGATYIDIGVLEISGALTISPLDVTGTAYDNFAPSSHAVSTSGATTQADEIVIALIGNFNITCTYTPDATYTLQNTDGANGMVQETKVISATGVQTCTVASNIGADSLMQIATYKAAAGGGPTPPKQLLTLGIG